MYVLSTYDNYPDNQLLPIQASPGIYIFFIIFILLNFFLFVTIPTAVIFDSYR